MYKNLMSFYYIYMRYSGGNIIFLNSSQAD